VKAGLTKAEKAVLDAVRELTAGGLAPTYDEIAARLGLRSRGQVAGHVHALRKKGRIEAGRQSRSIRIIDDGQPTDEVIASASAIRLRAVIEDAADVLAVQLGQSGAADILAKVLSKHRALAKAEIRPTDPDKKPPNPHRFARKPG
jgi:SOS-response transcriptional repressor LexA